MKGTHVPLHGLQTASTDEDVVLPGAGGDSPKATTMPLSTLLRHSTIACVCVAIMAHASAQGFIDTTLGQHIQLSKGAGTSGATPLPASLTAKRVWRLTLPAVLPYLGTNHEH